jgi:uncharacterized protein (TIGR03083 family)
MASAAHWPLVDVAQHLDAVHHEGLRLAQAAARSSLEAPIPTCPGWTMRDLLRHVGTVHRWATAHVSGARQDNFDPFAEVGDNWPPDADLIGWFSEGHAGLVQALGEAPADRQCFTFLPAPSPLAFWARRQAHETAVHRADAESASGAITSCAPEFARDGIDELLFGFLGRPGSQLTSNAPWTLHLHATDTDGEWLVRTQAEGLAITAEHGDDCDCTVAARASDLYLLVWNRRVAEGLAIDGDASLLARWRRGVRIRWR